MSSPIPVRLLPHSASLTPYTGVKASVDQFGTASDIHRVRFEQVQSFENGGLGDTKADKFTLFFDAKNSIGTVPKAKDKITFAGITLAVRTVKPCYGDSADVHHYEVALT